MVAKTNVERTLETVVDFQALHRQQMAEMIAHHDQAMDKVATSLDQLSVHVTSFFSGMNELRNLNRVMIQGIERLEQAIERQSQGFERLEQAIERQSQGFERLEQAMERQNQTLVGHLQLAQQQASTTAELTKLVVSQASMVDRLLAERAAA